MTHSSLLKTAAALFAVLAFTGCSLLKVSVATGDPLSRTEMNIRTLTRSFYYDLSAEIVRTADSIVAAAPETRFKTAAIRWKIRTTQAAVAAAMQGIPEVALADEWILCRQMEEAFNATPDSLLFGPQTDLARNTATQLARRAERLAREVLPHERYNLMTEFVTQYLRENPASGEGTAPVDTSFAWLQYLRDKGVEHTYAVGSISEVLADMGDRLSGQTRQLSNTVGWSKDILELQWQQDSLRSNLTRQLDSLERNFNRLTAVAENLPGISDAMIRSLNDQAKSLIYTLNYSVDNAFANLDRQREELQRFIAVERVSLVEAGRSALQDSLQQFTDSLPGLIGKILFYVVLALVVLLGLPFAAGFWFGRWRERAKTKKEKHS